MPNRRMEPQPKQDASISWRSVSRKYWIIGELVYGRPADMPGARPVREGEVWKWEAEEGESDVE